MSVRLYIGNLPKDVVERQELQDVFAAEGESVVTKLITDRKTGKCRGFGFVTVQTDELADEIIEKYNDVMFKESPIKIEKALPRNKTTKSEKEGPQRVDGGSTEGGSNTVTPMPIPAKVSSQMPKTTGGKKKRRNDRDRTKERVTSFSSSNMSDDAVQPDPRWASALAELKERLALANN
ncbi:MAG: RNA recognition motif domain-containing protein [Microcoleaceae cyanobacterium]